VTAPDDPREPGEGEPEEPAEPEPLLWRVIRSAIAPPVLDDGGRDAPLSRRGRILFRGTVTILVVAIAVLFLVTVSR
jgi:hypothetical protein